VRAAVEQQYREAGVIIPAGFTGAIDSGTPVSVTLVYNPVGDAVQRQMYLGVIEGSVGALSIRNQVFAGFDQLADLASLAPQDFQDRLQDDIDAQEAAAEDKEVNAPALAVVRVSPANYTLDAKPDTLQQTVPGYTVLFVFFLIGTVAASLALERDAGTMRRLFHAPVRHSTLQAGKLSAAFVVGVLQVALMFVVGRVGFGMGLGSSLLGLLLLTMALSATAVSLGLLVSTFGWSSVPSVPLIVAALLAGCMFPADWLPPFLRTIGRALPHSYAMQGYQDLLVRGQGLVAVLPEIGILLLYAAAAFLIGLRRYDFDQS
jgi:ABC-2 type transport system permease protein